MTFLNLRTNECQEVAEVEPEIVSPERDEEMKEDDSHSTLQKPPTILEEMENVSPSVEAPTAAKTEPPDETKPEARDPEPAAKPAEKEGNCYWFVYYFIATSSTVYSRLVHLYLQYERKEFEHCGIVLCHVPALVPRIVHQLSIGETGTVHDELRLSLQELLFYWGRKFQKESST